jgi:penicillin-binding protein 2
MKPSGEILALVSYPWYDSNIFNKTNFAADYARLIENPDKPFMNRTIQAYYPPASTFKILMTTGLLAENLVNPSHRILCSGSMVYGGETRRCWARGGHGMLNLQQGLANSCDIYFWVTGRDNMGVERIVKYAQEFGYGKKTGIDIPGEISGFVPTPQWKERRDHERWFPGDTMNISIGQGALQVTPLQVSNLVATVVNDGVGYRPHILKEVRDSGTGALERTVVPEIINDLRGMVPPETFLTVRYDMRSVVTEGTAKIANIAAVQIAGKTGTAEFGNNGDNGPWHHWFAAYGPFNTTNRDEQVIVTVLRDDGYNETNWSAAYAATLIFQGIFANQTYEEAVVGRRYVQTALRGRQD